MKKACDVEKTVYSGIFKGLEGVEFAYLFGSCARGDSFPLSDIDIAVYTGGGMTSLDDELRLHTELCRRLKTDKIDIVFLNRATNFMLLDEIVRRGRVIYDKNPSLREEFELKALHDAIDFKNQRKVFAGV